MNLRKLQVRAAYAVALVATAPAVFASETAYDGIVDAVDWGDVVTGITAIAALIAAVLVVMKGSKMLLRMIGR